jgi:DNA-binding response OmpR family regulator
MKPSTGHILYIEDDEDTRELVKYAMAMNNYKVIAAANLEDALRLARTYQFDLYLIDNWMSGGSGIELCKKLREFDTWTPILFYSGAALERDKQEAFAAGAHGYLVKPAGPDELVAEVIRIVSSATRTEAASFL